MAIRNQALRDHTTSATFVLTLGSSHIAALVMIDHRLRTNLTMDEDIEQYRKNGPQPGDIRVLSNGTYGRAFSLNGQPGLIRRGLITHTYPTGQGWRPSDIWTITPAGRLVINLLDEAGIWQEYGGVPPEVTAAVPASRTPARRRKEVA